MRILYRILLGLVVLVVILAVVGLFLPSEVHVERSETIAAPPATVYPLVADLHNWQRWIAWNKEMDPALEVTYNDVQSGKGAKYFWKGDKLGSGSVEITKADPEKGIEYDLTIGEEPPLKGVLNLEPADGGTKATWIFDGDMGNMPHSRYIGLLMDLMLGADFEKGLAKLKKIAEQPAAK